MQRQQITFSLKIQLGKSCELNEPSYTLLGMILIILLKKAACTDVIQGSESQLYNLTNN